jgi:SAM-dependent methyltransferase
MSIWHRVIHPITQHFRARRGQFMLAAFPSIATQRICDLGGSRHFWDKLGLNVPRQHITIYNISSGETQGMNAQAGQPLADGDIEVVIYNGQHIPVPDKHFDLLVCNSVLEHVPPAARAALVVEMRRVAKSVFCQTPARSFPLEPHFLMPFVHWLPRGLGYHLIKVSPWRLLSRPSAEVIEEYWWGTQLLGQAEVAALFPGARVQPESVLGLTKSYYVVDFVR